MLSFSFIVSSIVRDVQSISIDLMMTQLLLFRETERERQSGSSREREREREVCIVTQQGRR